MRRSLLLMLALLCLTTIARAQFIVVSGTQIVDGSNNKASNATLCAQTEAANGTSISLSLGAGGQTTKPPVCVPVTNGAFSISLPDTNSTSPQYACIAFTVTDNASGVSLLDLGYGCVQPTSATPSTWCSTSSGVTTCNFDLYKQNLPALALVQTGPPGPAPTLVAGTATSLAPTASPTVAVTPTGTPNTYSLNVGIPQGSPGSGATTNASQLISGYNALNANYFMLGQALNTAALGSPIRVVFMGDSLLYSQDTTVGASIYAWSIPTCSGGTGTATFSMVAKSPLLNLPVVLSGFPTSTFLNGQTTMVSALGSGTWSATVSCTTSGSATEAGKVYGAPANGATTTRSITPLPESFAYAASFLNPYVTVVNNSYPGDGTVQGLSRWMSGGSSANCGDITFMNYAANPAANYGGHGIEPPATYRANLTQMISTCTNAGKAVFLLLTQPVSYVVNSATIRAYVAIEEQVARSLGIQTIDLSEQLNWMTNYWSPDAVHLQPAAYADLGSELAGLLGTLGGTLARHVGPASYVYPYDNVHSQFTTATHSTCPVDSSVALAIPPGGSMAFPVYVDSTVQVNANVCSGSDGPVTAGLYYAESLTSVTPTDQVLAASTTATVSPFQLTRGYRTVVLRNDSGSGTLYFKSLYFAAPPSASITLASIALSSNYVTATDLNTQLCWPCSGVASSTTLHTPNPGISTYVWSNIGLGQAGYIMQTAINSIGVMYSRVDWNGTWSNWTIVSSPYVGAAIASAATIAPSGQIVHVTGTASISTMTPLPGFSSTFAGPQTLIADGAWTVAAGTSAGQFKNGFTAVAGTAYTFYYDGTLWYTK